MYKSVLAFTYLLFLNPSLSAMDFNETIIIINEAQKATQEIQSEFDILINDVVAPTKEKILEVNTTDSQITIIELNESLEINASILTKELNTSQILACKENNKTKAIDDSNNSIPDNGCTDTEVQGTSIRGLIIYKTRIKPFCEMSGETFAKQYMQEDWDDIYYEKEFKIEVLKACPKIERRYKDKWTPHLYQFAIEYASDSDAIPEC